LAKVSNEERSSPTIFARATASLAVALVLALTVLGASPDLHERLHRHGPGAAGTSQHGGGHSPSGQPADEDGCVVTLFTQGVVLALALLVLAFAGRTLSLLDLDPRDREAPAAPRYLRLPTQAPPVGLG
jgi:hypothetical protein